MVTKVRPKDLENGTQTPWNSKYYWTDGLGNFWFQDVPWASSTNTKQSLTYWEDLWVWVPVFLWTWIVNKELIQQLTETWDRNFWNWTNIRYQQPFFTWTQDNIIRSVTVKLKKTWSPTDNVNLYIISSDRNTVVATSTTTVWWGTITWSYVEYTFTFNDDVLWYNTLYYFELKRSSTQDASNYYKIEYGNVSTTYKIAWWDWYYNWSTRVRLDGGDAATAYYKIQMGYNYTSWSIYRIDTNYNSTSNCIWITAEAKTTWNTWLVTMLWTNSNFTNLIPNKQYSPNNSVVWSKVALFNSTSHFWYAVSNQEKYSTSFILWKTSIVSQVMLWISRNGTPSDNVIVRIETDNSWSPSWTLADVNATITIPSRDIFTTAKQMVYNFTSSFTCVAWTRYHIVLSRSWSLDTTHYYSVSISSTGSDYLYWYAQTYTNSVWTTATYSNYVYFNFMIDSKYYWQINYNTNLLMWYSATADQSTLAHCFVLDKATVLSWVLARVQKNSSPTDNFRISLRSNYSDTATISNLANTTNTSYDSMWTITQQKVAMRFRWTWWTANLLTRYLAIYTSKTWTPSDNIVVRIETELLSLPSWVLVDPSATFTLSNSFIPAWWWVVWKFSETISLTNDTYYWIIFSRTGSMDNSNYRNIWYWNSYWDTTCWDSIYNWSSWSAVETTRDIMFQFEWSNYIWDRPWVLVSSSSYWDIVWSALTTNAYAIEKFNFWTNVTLSANTKYWLVFERTWEYNTTNYYSLWYINAYTTWNYQFYQLQTATAQQLIAYWTRAPRHVFFYENTTTTWDNEKATNWWLSLYKWTYSWDDMVALNSTTIWIKIKKTILEWWEFSWSVIANWTSSYFKPTRNWLLYILGTVTAAQLIYIYSNVNAQSANDVEVARIYITAWWNITLPSFVPVTTNNYYKIYCAWAGTTCTYNFIPLW